MKEPCSPHTIFHLFTSPPTLVFILSLTLFFSGCAGKVDDSLWHQHYQPIEDLQALSFARDAFLEAQQQFGHAEYIVRDIHIRQSIVKKDIFSITRADIVDFNNMSRRIFFPQKGFPEEFIWSSLERKTREYVEQSASGRALSVDAQQSIVEALNALILSENFYQELVSYTYTESEEHYKAVKREDSAARKRYLRNFLASHFSGLLLPMPEKKYVLEGIEICECLEPDKDVCIVYVSTVPGSPLFYPQLAHEVFHLLSPDCYDWYVEGLSNLFSETFCKKAGYSWQPVLTSFNAKEKTDPYTISYFMMREMNKVAGPYLHNFLKFTVWSDTSKTKKHVDVDSWLTTLPPDIKRRVINIIHVYAPSLEANKGLHNSFYLP